MAARKKAQSERKIERVDTVRPFPVFYSNNAEVRTSPNDVEIVFSRILEASTEVFRFEIVNSVYMTHDHAVKLAEVILEQHKRRLEVLKEKVKKLDG